MKIPGRHTLALLLAAVFALTLLAGLGLLGGPDLAASDLLYQQRRASDGEIVLISIDQKALDELGPYSQWGRDIFARAVEALNADPEKRPAVIGLDVIFAGETTSEADARLAAAAGAGGNVVTAGAAEFGAALVERGEGDYTLAPSAVLAWDGPYPALAEVADLGHVNAMLDGDGILRHQLLTVRTPAGEEVPSFSLAVAEKYRKAAGLPAQPLPETEERGFWYLPYTNTPGGLSESISLADLLAGRVPASRYAGRIVLIGPYAAGLNDSFFTAIDHASPMYGVEVQANAVLALLREDFKREAGQGVQLTVLFALLLLAVFCFWRRRVVFSTAALVLLCGGWVALCRALYERGTVLHVLWVPAGVAVLYAACLALNYIRAALETRQVRRTFQRYVAPEIVRELLKDPDALELGGKLTSIAVLFVDIRGFTSMSEVLEPPQVVEILNRYLSLVSRCILDNGGTLDKFVGDAAMAFWGAPLSQEDYVMGAVRAARDMVEGSKALSEELLARFGRTVSFGIGIHVGEAVVGNIGSPQRMDYTAIGDTVNTAARLEANAPGNTVYISQAVADALAGRIRAVPLAEPLRLKGKREGFPVLVLEDILEEYGPNRGR